MRILAFAALMALAACDGPRENAGENADYAAGAVNSPDTLRQGPAVARTLRRIEDRWVEAGFPHGDQFEAIVAEALASDTAC